MTPCCCLEELRTDRSLSWSRNFFFGVSTTAPAADICPRNDETVFKPGFSASELGLMPRSGELVREVKLARLLLKIAVWEVFRRIPGNPQTKKRFDKVVRQPAK